jgi:hypothetical protein
LRTKECAKARALGMKGTLEAHNADLAEFSLESKDREGGKVCFDEKDAISTILETNQAQLEMNKEIRDYCQFKCNDIANIIADKTDNVERKEEQSMYHIPYNAPIKNWECYLMEEKKALNKLGTRD